MKMDIRQSPGAPLILSLSSASSSGSRIELGGTTGAITLIFARADTAAFQQPLGLPIPQFGGSRVWRIGSHDLQYTMPDGTIGYLLEGDVLLDPRVTA